MPEDNELDTSSEVTPETTDTTPAPDTGGDDFQQPETPDSKPETPADWRVEKYGADWQNSIDYHKDTNKYLRGELDKAKRKPQRRIEEAAHQEAKPQTQDARPQTPSPQTPSPYGDVQTVDEFGNRIESRFEQKLAEREQVMARESSFRASMQAVRRSEKGDPKRGIPSFSQLEQEVLIPAVERNPAILRILKETDFVDPETGEDKTGAAAYTLAFLLKYNTLDALEKLFAGKAREELGDRINEVSREAVRVNGRRDGATSGKLTPQQIASMPSAEFEKLVARNTGRMP